MNRKIAFKQEAREKMFEGVKILADAVTTTLGPKGRNVAIQRDWGEPIVVHDGVTVADNVDDKDPQIKIGIDLVREAARKTNEESGDGTTTATLLAYEIVRRGLELVKNGENPMVIRRQLYNILPTLIEELRNSSTKVKAGDLQKVAYISSADEEIGNLVADAIDKVGENGLVTTNEGVGISSELKFTQGMEFDKGFMSTSPYFITNPDRAEAVVIDPIIAVISKQISTIGEIKLLLETMAKVSKNIVVIAEEIKGDALYAMVENKRKGIIQALAVNAPGLGENKNNYLADIATYTGATVLSSQSAEEIQKGNWWGHASKVESGRDTTIIVEGGGDPKTILKRVSDLQTQVKNEKSVFEREKVSERLARLSTGVAVIEVGAKTEVEMREKIERTKDAIGAATAARDEGVVPGGGSALLRLKKLIKGENESEKMLSEVLESPVRKLMQNSDESSENISHYIKEITKNPELGYEVNEGKLINMLEAGVIDPVKVSRLALENAVSVATSILSTDATIVIEPDEKK